ncbi:MAG: radical SAM protein [Bdellovibrionaceae bacterium]|nr:radical SAM protein [Bdellovibrionales bacterium]MCB9085097.1 radical SAM protein [Pseudobdellovibrionaceae bacterium]
MSKTWCPLPWMSQAIRSNGDLRICCQANTAEGRGILYKENNEAFNAAEGNLAESRNSSLMCSVRKDMIEGRWPAACVRCQREEEAGLISRRSYEITNWAEKIDFDQAKLGTDANGSISIEKFPVRAMDIRFGNKCNLKCRMCSPMDSNSWYEDHYNLFGATYQEASGEVRLTPNEKGRFNTSPITYDWYESETFWQDLDRLIPDVQYIQTVGGEPFLIDQYYDFLQRMIDQGYAGETTLESNSNLTVLPERALELWRHFRKIRIGASIDGVGKVNDYIRHPSKWQLLEKNLHRLDKAEGPFELWFTSTIQVANILHFPSLVKWKIESEFQRFNNRRERPILTPHVLHRPLFFNIRIFPLEVKSKIAAHLYSLLPWFNSHFASEPDGKSKAAFYSANYKDMVDSFIKYMNAEDWSHELPKFWAVTQGLDKLRGENFADTFPELFAMLEPYLNSKEAERYKIVRTL